MMDKLERVYAKSRDLVEREIEGEIIIVPLTSGIGDLEDELFTLNEVGKDIWTRIDGKKSVGAITKELLEMYDGDAETLIRDVLGFLAELEKRKLVVEEVGCRIT